MLAHYCNKYSLPYILCLFVALILYPGGGGVVKSLFCFAVLFVLSSFAIISLGNRELNALFKLPF